VAAPALTRLRPPALRIGAVRRALSGRNVLVALVILVVAYLALVPLGFLFWQTFVRDGNLTLAAFREAYSETGLGVMALNSFAFAAGSTALAVVLGTGLAHLVCGRTCPSSR